MLLYVTRIWYNYRIAHRYQNIYQDIQKEEEQEMKKEEEEVSNSVAS